MRGNKAKCGKTWWNPADLSKANRNPKESSGWCSENSLMLVKRRSPLITKYEAIMNMAISLGCDYPKELEAGANAKYGSHAIIRGFLNSRF